MSLFSWCSRRSGGLAMIWLGLLCYWVIHQEAAATQHGLTAPHPESSDVSPPSGAGIWTVIFSWYCLLLHILILVFPFRACWAIWDLTSALQKTSRGEQPKKFKGSRISQRRRSIFKLPPIPEALAEPCDNASSSASNEASDLDSDPSTAVDASTDTESDAAQDRIVHAIIIPNCKEETDTLRETLDVLASHKQARNSYDVYLAMEQREDDAETKALLLIAEFVKKFRAIDFTLHPSGIPNESPGKGSNVNWAARKLSERYPMSCRKDVIITNIDADSHLSSRYFDLVSAMHMAHHETASTTMYSAPIIFDRNAHMIPAIVRVADIMWCAAGLSGLYSGSTIAPPTSVYSLPLQLVDRVGGWDCDSEAIGEDLHMYLKCFFALNGNLTVRAVLSPISQTNATAGGFGKGFHGTLSDMRARYKQALRHMWGSLDTGFALRKAVDLWKDRKQTFRAFRPLHNSMGDSMDTSVHHTQLEALSGHVDPERPVDSGYFSDVTHGVLKEPSYTHIFFLFHRLFEAHFLPTQTTIVVIASALYLRATHNTADIYGLAWIFEACKHLRTLGFVVVALYILMYEGFHKAAVAKREKEMNRAGLADGMNFSHRSFRQNWVDYFIPALAAPIYGAIPCVHAQICHFWTVDLTYIVSKKATRQRTKSMSGDTPA